MGKIIQDAAVLLELGISSSPTDAERAVVQQAVVKAEGSVIRFLGYNPVQASRTEYFPQQDFRSSGGESVWEVEGNQAILRRRAGASPDELQLTHIPVRSAPAIDLRIEYDGRFGAKSGAFAASTKKTEGTDFWPQYDSVDSDGKSVCSDGIIRSIGIWPTEPGSVKVVYTAGYSGDELAGSDSVLDASPIMDAVVEEALRRAKKVLALWTKNTRLGHAAGTITSESLGEYSYSLNAGMLDKLMGSGSLTADSKEKLQSYVNWGLVV